MFFVLSKLLIYLIMPLTIVFGLLALGLFMKNPRWKKRALWSCFIVFYLFSNEFIANEVMKAWEIPAKPFADIKKYKVGIVLTGTTMSGLQPDDRVYFSRDRITHTIQLYKLGLIEKILISGGIGRLIDTDEPEANKYQSVMIMMGIPPDDIIVENKTRNTAESAPAVKRILDSYHYKYEECLLITSAFHMRRSLAVYQKQGLNIDQFTTDFYSHPRSFYPDGLLLPQHEAISIWSKLMKEWIGIAAYKVSGYI
jgi:uncharacterized SAM-binding protein YcdF (DUF218 family)